MIYNYCIPVFSIPTVDQSINLHQIIDPVNSLIITVTFLWPDPGHTVSATDPMVYVPVQLFYTVTMII